MSFENNGMRLIIHAIIAVGVCRNIKPLLTNKKEVTSKYIYSLVYYIDVLKFST